MSAMVIITFLGIDLFLTHRGCSEDMLVLLGYVAIGIDGELVMVLMSTFFLLFE